MPPSPMTLSSVYFPPTTVPRAASTFGLRWRSCSASGVKVTVGSASLRSPGPPEPKSVVSVGTEPPPASPATAERVSVGSVELGSAGPGASVTKSVVAFALIDGWPGAAAARSKTASNSSTQRRSCSSRPHDRATNSARLAASPEAMASAKMARARSASESMARPGGKNRERERPGDTPPPAPCGPVTRSRTLPVLSVQTRTYRPNFEYAPCNWPSRWRRRAARPGSSATWRADSAAAMASGRRPASE